MVDKEKCSDVELMAGLILVLFEKNKYCANQIAAVFEIVERRVEKYKNLEPIIFEDFEGRANEIKSLREKIGEELFERIFND